MEPTITRDRWETDVPNYRRAYCEGASYFFTVVTCQRYPIFRNDDAVHLLQSCLRPVMYTHPFTLDAMVVLPDHLHCIWSLPSADRDFSTRWKQVKAQFTHRDLGEKAETISGSMHRKGEKGVWQRRFWEHLIRDQDDFNAHCDYIHYNPVKHGLVRSPSDWKHSTFRSLAEEGMYPADWGQDVSLHILVMDLE